MFVIVAGRRAGKTTALVDWFFEQPGYRGIIVANGSIQRNTVRELARKAVELRLDDRIDPKWLAKFVVVPQGFAMGGWLRGHQARVWAIDDADMVLQTIFGVEIDYLAINATLVPRLAQPRQEPVDGYIVDGEEREPASYRALPYSADAPGNPKLGPGRDNRMDV